VTCEELEELAGALALDAALPEEVAAAREHLRTCTRVHDSIREFVATASLLAIAAEPVEPPARLRDRILAAAHAELAVPAPAPSSVNAAGPPAPPPAERLEPTPLSLRRDRPPATSAVPAVRPAGGWSRALPGWLAAAAMLALAIGLGGWNVRLRDGIETRDNRLAAQRQALDTAARGGGGQWKRFTAVPELGEARGAVLVPDQGQGVVVLTGLKRPEDGKVYQLWAIRGSGPEDLGTFLPDEAGLAVIPLPELGKADRVAVTVEPQRMPRPTGPTVLDASLRISTLPRMLSWLQ
jgi:hypothetical protein